MKELTKAEEQVMQVLWSLEKGFMKDIHEAIPEPRPAYTTVSTVVRVLVKKGAIGFNSYGKVHDYYPLFSKEDYSSGQLKQMVKSFFNNSFQQFASFFTKDSKMELEELEKMKRMIEEEIAQRKKDGD